MYGEYMQEEGPAGQQAIDTIMSANHDVTTVINNHREILRNGGIVQAPAPSQTVSTIACPVNLRKENFSLVKRGYPANGVYTLTC